MGIMPPHPAVFMKSKLYNQTGFFNLDYKETMVQKKIKFEPSQEIIKSNGLIVIEVPDLESLINKVGFDTIYHEHRNYFSENSLYKLFKMQKIYSWGLFY